MVIGAVKLLALTVKVFTVPAVPAVVVPRSSVAGATVIVGAALTVPVTVTFWVVAPVLVSLMTPLTAPAAAVALMRALMVVLATVPPVGVSVTVLEYVMPQVEISTTVGAGMVIGAGKLLALTVKVLTVPAVPAVVVPRSSVAGVTVMVGAALPLSVPTRRSSDLPVLVSLMTPLTAPAAAAALMRALMVVLATVPPVGVSVTVL